MPNQKKFVRPSSRSRLIRRGLGTTHPDPKWRSWWKLAWKNHFFWFVATCGSPNKLSWSTAHQPTRPDTMFRDLVRRASILSQTCRNSPHTSRRVKSFCSPTKNRLVCGGLTVSPCSHIGNIFFLPRNKKWFWVFQKQFFGGSVTLKNGSETKPNERRAQPTIENGAFYCTEIIYLLQRKWDTGRASIGMTEQDIRWKLQGILFRFLSTVTNQTVLSLHKNEQTTTIGNHVTVYRRRPSLSYFPAGICRIHEAPLSFTGYVMVKASKFAVLNRTKLRFLCNST